MMVKQKMRITDMTEGKPMRLILTFAVPMLIGNVFQQVYSIVDTMVAGYCLGDSAIAAIGATSSLYGLIINLAWGMNGGFALVVTRSFGAHNEIRLKKSVAGTLLLDSGISLGLTILALLFLRPLMRLMNTPEGIFADAYTYLFIICTGIVTTVAYNMFSSLLRAVGNSITPLYFLIFSSVMNIGLDLLFVAVCHMGIGGAALATVLSQLLSAVLSGGYFFRNYRTMIPSTKDFRPDAPLLKELLGNGAAMAFMYSVVDMGSAIFQSANNALAKILGNYIIIAHTSARRLIGMMMTPLGTLSSAGATFIGQNYGAGKTDRIRDGLKQECLMAVCWGVFACAMIYLLGIDLVHWITGTEDLQVIDNAVLSLRLHLPFYPILGILLVLRTAMQAVNQKMPTVISSSIELGMKLLAAFVLIPRLGFFGTCITEPVTWTLCAAFLCVVWSGKRKELFGRV